MRSPAEIIIEKFGGPAKLAAVLGLDVSRVYRWTYPEDRGGTGGLVPQKHHVKLIEVAKASGIPISPVDFYPGGGSETPTPQHMDAAS